MPTTSCIVNPRHASWAALSFEKGDAVATLAPTDLGMRKVKRLASTSARPASGHTPASQACSTRASSELLPPAAPAMLAPGSSGPTSPTAAAPPSTDERRGLLPACAAAPAPNCCVACRSALRALRGAVCGRMCGGHVTATCGDSFLLWAAHAHPSPLQRPLRHPPQKRPCGPRLASQAKPNTFGSPLGGCWQAAPAVPHGAVQLPTAQLPN